MMEKKRKGDDLINQRKGNNERAEPETTLSYDHLQFQTLTDRELDDNLQKYRVHIVKLGPNLPDKGEKIRFTIGCLEAEKHNRNLRLNGTPSTKAFAKKQQDLGSGKHNNEEQKLREPKHTQNKFHVGSRRETSKGRKNYFPAHSSTDALILGDYNFDVHQSHRKWSFEECPSEIATSLKTSEESVVNVDDEETLSCTAVKQSAQGDDPNVQVSIKDIECLAPGKFFNSQVMNFYISFLQQQVSSVNGFHFFNTFFYKKLTDVVTSVSKGADKIASFVNLRRWWKGVDIFRQAYIFIPIHSCAHWSLIIVCIPDKKDESGVAVLHMNSNGIDLERSIAIMYVKRFLEYEWNYLNQDTIKDDYSLDLPISQKLWTILPSRIFGLDVPVPRQKNNFDCGPFVLFFMKQFIKDAPSRLKWNVSMFGNKWFQPDEASALRIEIKNTLSHLFCVRGQQS